MKASDYIAEFLASRGVDAIYEVVGGMITHLLDSVHKSGKIKVVSVHHEQAAAFAVDGHGRMTGKPVVAMATSGPGATNLLTGMGSCFFDSVPSVFITGQVNRHELKGNKKVRQLGFQETDIVSMAQPITKAAWIVTEPEKLPQMLNEAFELAVSGRPGPVLLDIPMDVQRVDIPNDIACSSAVGINECPIPDLLWESLAQAKRPLLILGGGGSLPGTREKLREFVNTLKVPAVCSLLGNDILESGHPGRIGFYGSYGNRWANYAVGRADWMLVLGSRLDIRQTGADTESFAADKKIFHVDVDVSEMNNRVSTTSVIHACLNDFLHAAAERVSKASLEISDWYDEIGEKKREWPADGEYQSEGINPNRFLSEISCVQNAASAYVADVGQHQMWSAQSIHFHEGQRFLTSGGMGAMGYGLPAAIGAAFAVPGKPVVLVAGDGGFQLNLQELQTVVRNKIPVKIILLNNKCHGMVRQFQQSYFHSRYQSTVWGYDAPDFEKIGKAYGMASMTVDDPEQTESAASFFWSDPQEPVLLQVMLEVEGNVYPKIAFGHPLTEMEPEYTPLEMEGT